MTIPAGAQIVSDAFDFDLPPLSDIAVTIHLRGAPAAVTGHPGSRTTSYLQPGNDTTALELPAAIPVVHWYFLSGVEVLASPTASAVAILGDSISDGRGSTTDGNDRWTDNLARRLHAASPNSPIAVLNLALGGNRLLRDGVGPNALARFDRDILSQPHVKWLIVLEGINDIGNAADCARQRRVGADGRRRHPRVRTDHRARARARHPRLWRNAHAVRRVQALRHAGGRERTPARQRLDPDERQVRRRDRLRRGHTRSRAADAPLATGGQRGSSPSVAGRLSDHGRGH